MRQRAATGTYAWNSYGQQQASYPAGRADYASARARYVRVSRVENAYG